jgi:hypothetical protein
VGAAKTLGSVPDPTPVDEPKQMVGDLVFFALPSELFRTLSIEAAKRNMTLAQLLSQAVSAYLAKTKDP